ncbi:hypothetical protein [Aquimarina sp. LLG6339-5]|uniref:hypothetical protein n=1 Tax=Aquimarina sp. LLG6339-5 TaxID=3160830 RepID=UPI003866A2EA
MLHEFLKLDFAEKISKNEQKTINGGMRTLTSICFGTGTGGGSSVGFSQACVGRTEDTDCIINGYQASCAGNGSGDFWYL